MSVFINGVKVTLIICLTIVVTCVLCISYLEYLNRYSITQSSNEAIYIFDKKSTILNRCDKEGCKVIDTKLPAKVTNQVVPASGSTPNKLFGENGSNNPMTSEIAQSISQTSEQQTTETQQIDQEQNAVADEPQEISTEEPDVVEPESQEAPVNAKKEVAIARNKKSSGPKPITVVRAR